MLDNPTDSLCESHSVMSDSLQPHGLYSPWNSPGQNTGVGGCSLLQGIFPTQHQTHISRITGRFFTSWATREAHKFTLKWCFFFEIQYEQYNYTFLFQPSFLKGGDSMVGGLSPSWEEHPKPRYDQCWDLCAHLSYKIFFHQRAIFTLASPSFLHS